MKNYSNKQIKIIFAIIGIAILRNQLWILPSPLMHEVMIDLNASYTQVGLMINIVGLGMSIAAITGAVIIEKIGATTTLLLSGLFLIFDGVASICNLPYYILLFFRIITGFSYGFSTAAIISLISGNFKPNQRAKVSGIYAASGGLSLAFANAFNFTLSEILTSWRVLMFAWSCIAAIYSIIIFFNFRDDIFLVIKKPDANIGKNIAIKQVFRIKEIWIFILVMLGPGLISVCHNSYLPSILRDLHCFSPQKSGLYVSILSFSGIFGSLLITSIVSHCRDLRYIVALLVSVTVICSIGILTSTADLLILISILILGLSSQSTNPIMETLIMNMPNMNSNRATSVITLCVSINGIAYLFIPSLFDVSNQVIGMNFVLLPFWIIAIVFSYSIFIISKHKIRE